jgi:1-acyl-sn-glycerol-3-phosphate acyltransferase
VWQNALHECLALAVKQLNYYTRWLGTGLSFALFGIGGLAQSLLIHPLIWLLIRNDKQRRQISRRIAGASMRLFVATMHSLGVLSYEISGRENIVPGKSYLILANHPSLIDVVFLLSIFPHADCVVKEAMARNPLFYGLIKAAGYISNSDSVSMLYHAVESIQSGESLIIFPEGTRTESGAQPVFKSGAAAIAVRTGCECLPVFINCWPTTLTRTDHWYRIPDEKVRFTAAIQPPIDVALWASDSNDQRGATQKVGAELQSYFLQGLSNSRSGNQT